MAFVPGFQHDVFVSYAHGDNRAWLDQLIARLQTELQRRLGVPTDIWIDKEDLRQSLDFRAEIPERLSASAILLFFPSPSYLRSHYCVHTECRAFAESLPTRRARVRNPKLANELFALRCPILPLPDNAQRLLIDGLSDIPFCDDDGTFSVGSAGFESAFSQVLGQLVTLLQLMRNDRTPVFVYPKQPDDDVADAHKALTAELSARGFRVLPETEVAVVDDLKQAAVAVFLWGRKYDQLAERLIQLVKQKPNQAWLTWTAAEATTDAEPPQAAFLEELRGLQSQTRTDLGVDPPMSKLKEEALALLQPDPVTPKPSGKPRVYLVFNTRDQVERLRAGRISRRYISDFHFDYPDDRALHTRRLAQSDYVLLVWGRSDESWCSAEFADIVQVAKAQSAKGLCVFDPRETKDSTVTRIRSDFRDIYVAEMFGADEDLQRVDPFFRQRPPSGAA